MALRLIILMSCIMVVTMLLPQDWFPVGCEINPCHDEGCIHADKEFGMYFWFPYADASTQAMIDALKVKGRETYKHANLFVYFGGVPALALFNGWLHRQRWFWHVGMIASVGIMFLIGQCSPPVGSMKPNLTMYDFETWYFYCTEFCMRLANATGITYGGVCFLLFVVAIPGVLCFDLLWGLWRRWSGGGEALE